MSDFRNQEDYWKPCQPGSIFGASKNKKNRQRRHFLVQLAMGSVVAATGALSAVFIATQKNRVAQGGEDLTPMNKEADDLVCSVVQNLTPRYVQAIRQADTSRSSEDKELIVQFDKHLRKCSKCAVAVLKAVNQV